MLIGHAGAPLAPHDLWEAWHLDPLVVVGLVLAGVAYRRGRGARRSPEPDWRTLSFGAGLVVLAIALLSPLDALSAELASAHMVQHVLLGIVAPPLLIAGAAGSRTLRGVPADWRRAVLGWQRRHGVPPHRWRFLRSSVLAWLLSVAVLWFWHGSVPYEAAVRHDAVHAVEHGTFLVAGLAFWRCVVPARVGGTSPGYGVLLLFTMGTQGGLLAALLTFARSPWYESYTASAPRWGLDPLTDQQLAGVLMWVPAGAIYAASALALIVVWLRDTEAAAQPSLAASDARADRRPA